MSLQDRLVLLMAFKITQRLSTEELASQLREGPERVYWVLEFLVVRGLVKPQHDDGTWTLTSKGNLRRCRLTA